MQWLCSAHKAGREGIPPGATHGIHAWAGRKNEIAMEQASCTVKQAVRPIKLAFLVPSRNRAAVQQAIEINTLLWGGTYNPILPLHHRVPDSWKGVGSRIRSANDVLIGYIKHFDPDYVVNISIPENHIPDVGFRKVIKPDNIMGGFKEYEIPSFGISVYEVIAELIAKELRFVQRKPHRLILPRAAKAQSLFLNSVFGKFPSLANTTLRQILVKEYAAEEPVATIENFGDFMSSEILFPRRLASLHVNWERDSRWMHRNVVFCLDATNTGDIIDYWNLRAAGWNVAPYPLQSRNSVMTLKYLNDFIRTYLINDSHDPAHPHRVTVMKGRSVTDNDFNEAIRALESTTSGSNAAAPYAVQHWYPRLWDKWAAEKDHTPPHEIYGDKRETETYYHDEMLKFKPLPPPFKVSRPCLSDPWFANTVELRTFDGVEPVAEVIPEASSGVSEAFALFPAREEWRLSASGLVYLGRFDDTQIVLGLPTGQKVVGEWLKSKGWKIATSSAGKMMLHSFKRLGGKYWLSLLAQKGLMKLLRVLSDGKPVRSGALWQQLKSIMKSETPKSTSNFLAKLIKVGILKLGISVQCSTCWRSAWYSVTDLSYEVNCTFCGEKFSLPTHNPAELVWAYRAVGPLCSPSESEGAAVVLLTQRFFSLAQGMSTTPGFGVSMEKGDRTIEVDLALFAKHGIFARDSRSELILVECKTESEFEREDVAKMKYLGTEFPGCVLTFATIREALTPAEMGRLRPLVIKGRRLRKVGRPYNPVLILTGVELTSRGLGQMAWHEKGGKYAALAESLRASADLASLCDATQELYLDMQSWYDWIRDAWEAPLKSQ